jgi:hypothetical protein
VLTEIWRHFGGVNLDTFDVMGTNEGEYFVQVTLFDKKKEFAWNLVVVYGDAQPERKAFFFAELYTF